MIGYRVDNIIIIIIIILLLSDVGNARVIIEAVLLIEIITPLLI